MSDAKCRECGHVEADHDGYGGLCDGLGYNESRTICGCQEFVPIHKLRPRRSRMTEYTAGRELDAEIATRVMGLASGSVTPYPEYSTEIAVAWTVVEKMAERGHYMEISDQRHGFYRWEGAGPSWRGFHVTTCHPIADANPDFDGAPAEGASAFAETAPLAICIAALRAIEFATAKRERPE